MLRVAPKNAPYKFIVIINDKFCKVTHVPRRSAIPNPMGGAPALPFWGYICPNGMKKNNKILHGDQIG